MCEQVWSWFRNYTSALNTVNPSRQLFYVVSFATQNNAMMEESDGSHLPKFRRTSTSLEATRALII